MKKLINTTNNPFITINTEGTKATLAKPGQPVIITTTFGCEDCGRPIFQPIRPALCMCRPCIAAHGWD